MSETRVVNGRVYKVIEIPQEDVQEVRKRHSLSEHVGTRPMVDTTTAYGESSYHGRTAPKYTGERR